jgi:hypothetical protein
MKKALITIAMLASSMAATAQDSHWRIFAGLGYASGGEKLYSGTIVTIGTNKVTPFDIQSGIGFQERIGAEYRLADRFTVQASIGHSASEAMGINGTADFTTIPLELMGFVEAGKGFRIGAGVRQSSAELRGSGVVANIPINGSYTGSTGSVLEIQYLFNNGAIHNASAPAQFGLCVRSITETFSHTLGQLNGDHVEVGVVLYY